MVNILKHGAFGGPQPAGPVDVLHNLLVPLLYLIKEAANRRQRNSGVIHHMLASVAAYYLCKWLDGYD